MFDNTDVFEVGPDFGAELIPALPVAQEGDARRRRLSSLCKPLGTRLVGGTSPRGDRQADHLNVLKMEPKLGQAEALRRLALSIASMAPGIPFMARTA